MTAHNWRSLRVRAAGNGIGNLMAVSTMHTVLDLTEQLGAESSTHGAKTTQEAESALESYYGKLYRVDLTTRQVDGDGYMPPPPGFSDDEVEASFDAFLSKGPAA